MYSSPRAPPNKSPRGLRRTALSRSPSRQAAQGIEKSSAENNPSASSKDMGNVPSNGDDAADGEPKSGLMLRLPHDFRGTVPKKPPAQPVSTLFTSLENPGMPRIDVGTAKVDIDKDGPKIPFQLGVELGMQIRGSSVPVTHAASKQTGTSGLVASSQHHSSHGDADGPPVMPSQGNLLSNVEGLGRLNDTQVLVRNRGHGDWNKAKSTSSSSLAETDNDRQAPRPETSSRATEAYNEQLSKTIPAVSTAGFVSQVFVSPSEALLHGSLAQDHRQVSSEMLHSDPTSLLNRPLALRAPQTSSPLSLGPVLLARQSRNPPTSMKVSLQERGKHEQDAVSKDLTSESVPIRRTLSLRQPASTAPAKRLMFGVEGRKGISRAVSVTEAFTATVKPHLKKNVPLNPLPSQDFVIPFEDPSEGALGTSAGLIQDGTTEGSIPELPVISTAHARSDEKHHQNLSPETSDVSSIQVAPVTDAEVIVEEPARRSSTGRDLVKVSARVKELEEALEKQKGERDLLEGLLWRARGKSSRSRRSEMRSPSPLPVLAKTGRQSAVQPLGNVPPNVLRCQVDLTSGEKSGSVKSRGPIMIPSLAYRQQTLARDSLVSDSGGCESGVDHTHAAEVETTGLSRHAVRGRASAPLCDTASQGQRSSRDDALVNGGPGLQDYVDLEITKRDEQWSEEVGKIMEKVRAERDLAQAQIAELQRQVVELTGGEGYTKFKASSSFVGATEQSKSGTFHTSGSDSDERQPKDGQGTTGHKGGRRAPDAVEGDMKDEPDTMSSPTETFSPEKAAQELLVLKSRSEDLASLVALLSKTLKEREDELQKLRDAYESTAGASKEAEAALGIAEIRIKELQAEVEEARTRNEANNLGGASPVTPQRTASMVEDLQEEMSEKQEAIAYLHDAKRALTTQLKEQKMSASMLQRELAAVREERDQLELRTGEVEASWKRMEAKVNKLEMDVREAREEREQWRQKSMHAREDLEAQAELMRRAKEQGDESLSKMKTEKDALQRQVEGLKEDVARGKVREDALRTVLEEKDHDLQELNVKLEEGQQSLRAVQVELLRLRYLSQQDCSARYALQAQKEELERLMKVHEAARFQLNKELECLRSDLRIEKEKYSVVKGSFEVVEEKLRKEAAKAADLLIRSEAHEREKQQLLLQLEGSQREAVMQRAAADQKDVELHLWKKAHDEVSSALYALKAGSPGINVPADAGAGSPTEPFPWDA